MIRRSACVLVLLALVACPSKGRRVPAPAEPREDPVRGGVLNVTIVDDVDYLDPHRAGLPAAFAVMRALHRGLMAFPAEPSAGGASVAAPAGAADPVPDLAVAPPVVSPDRLTYTFTLRDDAAFGPPANRAVRAMDVVAGLRRATARGSVSPYASYLRIVTGVQAADDRTVVVTLSRPFNDLLWLLAVPAASAVPAELEANLRPAPAAIAPSGPYMLAASDGYVPEQAIHLVRNPAWRAASDPVRRAYVDEVKISVARDEADARASVAGGKADLSLDTPPDLAALTPQLRARVHTQPSACLRYLWMNTRVAPLSSVTLRRSVAATVDRAAVIAARGGDLDGAPALRPIVRGVAGHEPAVATPSPSATPAAKPTPRFTIPLVVGDRAVDRAEAGAVASALAYAGVRTVIRPTPIASLYVDAYEIPARRVPMGIATWCADWPGMAGRSLLAPLVDGRRIPREGNQNYSMIHAPSLERLLDAAALAEPGAASAAWVVAAAETGRLSPIVPLVDLNEVSLVSARLGGLGASTAYPRGDLTAAWLRP